MNILTTLRNILKAGPSTPSTWRHDAAPFTIRVDPSVASGRLLQATARAIEFWNEHVPGLFAPYGQTSRGAKLVIAPMPANPAELGSTYVHFATRWGRIRSAVLFVNAEQAVGFSDLVLWRFMVHGLGQAMGLKKPCPSAGNRYAFLGVGT